MSGGPRQTQGPTWTARSLGSWAAVMGCAALGWTGCAPIPPPDVLQEIDQVRAAPASVQAKQLAPAAFAHAERLRAEAYQALEADDFAGAQIIAERAHAAYVQAAVLARIARADKVQVEAKAEADRAARQLDEQDTEHQRVAADIAALELRLEVLRHAEGIRPSGQAGAAREVARLEAARAVSWQAHLLCAAGQLLAAEHAAKTPAPVELGQARQKLAALEGALAASPAAAPIDQAMRVRAGCLAALTAVRRALGRGPSPTVAADALLEELSKVGHGDPLRDDRGVVVSMRGVFKGAALDPKAERALQQFGSVAARHPRLPLMVVLHQRGPVAPADQARWQARGRAVAQALGRDAAPVELAGGSHPVVDPRGPYAARNERVEIVFVAPRQP